VENTLETVTIKVEEDLKRKMEAIKENWSAYLREAIRRRVEQEERKKAAETLLEGLKTNSMKVPEGFINTVIRETRESN
jgi:predicted transcriptional regulator